jgi:NodT family efflux transporter outer membrane factor (OMF) lipoprotein
MSPKVARCISIAAASLLIGGCAVHEGGFDDPIQMPGAFVGEERAGAFEAAVPDRWWHAFEDAHLNALQSAALTENFDLATFRDRLAAARAVVRRERAALFPSVEYGAFGEQTRLSRDDWRGDELFGASLTGVYELDLWQQNQNRAEAASLREAVAREELVAAAVSLSGEVARAWYALIEQRGQLRVLDAQVQTNRDVLKVVELRFANGVVRASDVLRQQRLLESTLEQRAVVLANIEVLEHALLVLVGRSPTQRFAAAPDELPALPPRPELGLPSELVQRRPDVRAALLGIRAADADAAVAVAERFPSVTLRAEASTVEENIGDLFDNWAALLRIDIVGPLFDAGAREAEVDRALAVKSERVSTYAQTVLEAFRQVVDAVSREVGREEQIERLNRQLELARRTSDRLNREYLNGDISYIDVLDALTTEQQLQRDLLRARFDRVSDRINLYQALAGGWPDIIPPNDDTERSGSTAAMSKQ